MGSFNPPPTPPDLFRLLQNARLLLGDRVRERERERDAAALSLAELEFADHSVQLLQ